MPDALVPHLHATLRMDWERPPAAISRRLGALPRAPASASSSILERVDQRCRASAGADRPSPLAFIQEHAGLASAVTFERMQQLQGLLLGEEAPPFRSGPAYAGHRPERYAWFSRAEAMFRIKVARDDADDCHPLVKAARLYLDIRYFHPFTDGNARATLLWTVFHCLRAQLPLPDPRRLWGLRFDAGHPDAYWAVVLALCEPAA